MKRVIGVLILVVIGLGAAILGAAGAAFRTQQGREVVARAALDVANESLLGSVTIDAVGGTLLGGLEARGVVLRDTAGVEVARIARLSVQYRLRDLLGGRIVLGQVGLDTPVVLLEQRPDRRLNFEEILHLGEPGRGPGGPNPLVAFRDATVRGGSVTVRTRLDPGHSVVSEEDTIGDVRFQVRRIEGVNAEFSYVRLASPIPAEKPIHLEIAALEARLSDPGLVINDARGLIETHGDSVTMDLAEARLPRSRLRVRGSLWGSEYGLQIDLAIQAPSASTDDMRGLARQLPPGLDGRAVVVVRTVARDEMRVTAEDLALTGRGGGGRFRGRVGLHLGPDDDWGLENVRVELDDFDINYFRSMLDTLPIDGRLTGPFRGNGNRSALQVNVDWMFRDSLVPGWPSSVVRGDGGVRLGVPGEFVFDGFAVRAASLDLGSIHRLIPAIELAGMLDGAGTLNGPWREMQFSGTLRHTHGDRPASLARGVIRADTRGDTLGIWADLVVDPLDLTGIASTLHGLRVQGAFSGEVHVAGYVDSLVTSVAVTGSAGEIRGGGAFTVIPPHLAVRALDVRAHGLNLAALNAELPRSYLNGRMTGTAGQDTLIALSADLAVRLDSSFAAGIRIDSLQGGAGVRDSLATADSLWAWGPRYSGMAHGSIGFGAQRADTMAIRFASDSLEALAPLVARWIAPDSVVIPDSVVGRVEARADLTGSFTNYAVSGAVTVLGAQWGRIRTGTGTVKGQWSTESRGVVSLEGRIDTLFFDRQRFTAVEVSATGRRDSASWEARSRIGADAAWIGGGRWLPDSAGHVVPLDSLGILLPSQAWFLERGGTVGVTDSAILLDSLKFRSADGSGMVTADGTFPRLAEGRLSVTVQGLPVPDVWALLQLDPARAGGELNGTLLLEGRARSPRMRGALAFQDGVFGDFRVSLIEGTIDYHDQRLVGNFGVFEIGQRLLNLDLDLPLDLTLTAVPRRRLRGALSIRAKADSLDMAFLNALTPSVRRVSGRLNADVGITGTWEQPELTGSLTVADAALTLPGLGISPYALNGRVHLSRDTLYLDELGVRSGTGAAQIGGTIRLEGLTRPNLDLRIEGQDFRSIDVRNVLTLTASGNLRLRGPLFGATLTGTGVATHGVLYFADMIEKDIISIEDTLYRDVVDTALRSLIRRERLGTEFQNRFLDSLAMDSVRLVMGEDMWLRSSEANIQLAGEVRVNKSADRYRIDGTLETPRGTYRLPLGLGGFINREFDVTRGQVQYFGTADLNAALDIDARHVVRSVRAENLSVFVHVGGTLEVPKLTLTSDVRPPISETEIISYLLFGAPSVEALATGGRQEQLLFQQTMAQFTGILSGRLENLLLSDLGVPLDYFAIRSDLTHPQGTQVALGRRIGERLFLTVSPRFCPKEAVLRNLGGSVEFRMSREWRLAASADPVRSCEQVGSAQIGGFTYQLGVDLLWDRSY